MACSLGSKEACTMMQAAHHSCVLLLSRQLIKFLSTEARRAGKLREKLEKVEVWTQQRRIPSTLTRRIRAYYAEIWLDYVGADTTSRKAVCCPGLIT